MNRLRLIAFVTLTFSGLLSLAQYGEISAVDSKTVQEALLTAQAAITAGDHVSGKILCKKAIRILEVNQRNSRAAHWLLGKVYLEEGKNYAAYEEFVYEWRPGRFPVEDLFVAVAGSRAQKGVGSTALAAFLDKQDGGKALVGDSSCLPPNAMGQRAGVEASSLILLAAMPETAPQDALKYAIQAEKICHGFPVTSYVMGKAYSRLGQYVKAKACFDKVDQAAPAKLRALIQAANKSNDALMRGART